MKQPANARNNYNRMKATRIERGIWRHFDPVTGWERFRVFTTVEGVMIQEYFETLDAARVFYAEIKSGPQETYPGYNRAKKPDHNGNPLPRGVQFREARSRGKYVTTSYSATHGAPQKGGKRWDFVFDPDSQQDADRALARALAKRKWAVAKYGPPLR